MIFFSKPKFKTNELIQASLFAALITVGAYIKISHPISIVPFTLQYLFTNLAGLLLGRRLGFTSVGIYIMLGLAGLPLFTGGGGIGYVLTPSFGYIIGFLIGAFVAGDLAERLPFPPFQRYVIAGLINLAIIYTIGVFYLMMILRANGNPIPISKAIWSYAVIYLTNDVPLCFLAAFITTRIKPILRSRTFH